MTKQPSTQASLARAFADVGGFRADLLDCPIDDLPSQQPALTLVGGRPVYDPDGLLGSAGVGIRPVAAAPGTSQRYEVTFGTGADDGLEISGCYQVDLGAEDPRTQL